MSLTVCGLRGLAYRSQGRGQSIYCHKAGEPVAFRTLGAWERGPLGLMKKGLVDTLQVSLSLFMSATLPNKPSYAETSGSRSHPHTSAPWSRYLPPQKRPVLKETVSSAFHAAIGMIQSHPVFEVPNRLHSGILLSRATLPGTNRSDIFFLESLSSCSCLLLQGQGLLPESFLFPTGAPASPWPPVSSFAASPQLLPGSMSETS